MIKLHAFPLYYSLDCEGIAKIKLNIGDIELNREVAIKLYLTSCSLQAQVKGDDKGQFEKHTGVSTPEYFTNMVLKFGKEIMTERPNIEQVQTLYNSGRSNFHCVK